MTTSSKPRALPQPGETRAYPVLPLRDIVVLSSLRRTREVDPRARRGDAQRHVHPARDPEERLRRRSCDRRDLRGRHARERAAAAQAARRHREGAGRGRGARARGQVRRAHRLLRGRRDLARRRRRRARRGRGADAFGRHRVRELREAQQEGVAGSGRRGPADRGLCQARRHRRLAPRGQDSRQAGDPRDHEGHRAPGEGAWPDGERNFRPAGGKAHPHPRQAADGEDAARVLPQ